MNTAQQKSDQETLSPLSRIGEGFLVVCMILLFGFLHYHQVMNTGFFAAKFGVPEMFWLYGPLLFGISAPAVRAWSGQRNLARPFEAATSLFLAIGSLWLVIVFPFNYAHLADALPEAICFLLAWVTDDIGKVVLVLQVIISPISALLTIWKYLSIRRQESELYLKQRTS